MNINILSTGSIGNCISISDNETYILLDCGLSIKKIKKLLKFELFKHKACLVSHGHKDHNKNIKELANTGIKIYSHAKTFENEHFNYKIIEAEKQFNIGTFNIIPFECNHNIKCFGYYIYSKKINERLLFFTDTSYIFNKFDQINYLLAECNYINAIYQENLLSGQYPGNTINHMELATLKIMIKANNWQNLKEIYILHVSNKNGDKKIIKKEIQAITGAIVYI